MTIRTQLTSTLAIALLVASSLTLAAEEKGYWRAVSSTARSITGDVTLSDEKITINFAGFTMSRIRTLEPAELASVFDVDSASATGAGLYRLNIPAQKRFLHKNTLCGSADTQWMVAYASGNDLQLAFFSGDKPPVFTLSAIQNSTDMCGTYSYTR